MNSFTALMTSHNTTGPAGEHLTEDCFQANPLPFANGGSALRWGGSNITEECKDGRYDKCRVQFNATDVRY
jgi:hypothetical protein